MASNEIVLLDEGALKGMVYEIRGQKVMLDFDLAGIYGYQTKRFDEQIQRNVERFPEEFRFRLSEWEWGSILRLKKSTANKKTSMNRSLPYAFTKQGITRQRRMR